MDITLLTEREVGRFHRQEHQDDAAVASAKSRPCRNEIWPDRNVHPQSRSQIGCDLGKSAPVASQHNRNKKAANVPALRPLNLETS